MRILIVARHPLDAIGGSEIQSDLLGATWADQGVEVLFFAVDGCQAEYNAAYQVRTGRLRRRVLDDLISEFAPDLVYFRFNRHRLWMVTSVLAKHGCRSVFAVSHYLDVTPWYWRPPPPGLNLAQGIRRCIGECSYLLINLLNYRRIARFDGGVSLRQDLLAELPMLAKCCVRDVVFLRSTPFEWPRPFVAWVASLKSDKRPEVFVELARRCQDLELDFLMVGRLVETHYRGVLDVAPANLHYLGEVEPPAVNGLLASSLMLVHTCKPEGFGNNFMQAWLQGKPTLTLEFDPDGLIEDRGLGYRTDTLDGLEQRVRELCFDEPLRAEMGRRARELVDADFDQVANGRRLLEFFEQLLAVRTGPELG